jgi:hypothetical protein
MICPGDPSDATPFGGWLKKLKRFCVSLQVVSGIGYKVRRTPNGTILEILPGAGGGGEPAAVERFTLTGVAQEYISATRISDGAAVNIAKPYKLRASNTSASIEGVTVTYTSQGPQARKAQTLVDSEIQIIIPRYLGGDIIYAVKVEGNSGVTAPGGAALEYIDLNVDGRAWAREFNQ